MSNHLVEATGIVLGYDRHIAVTASDLTLPYGGVTAIIGPNGSGKSTLLHAIAGLVEPSHGTLRVKGLDPTQGIPSVSYVLQSMAAPTGVPLTVRETVTMGRYSRLGWWRRFTAADKQAVATAMERLDITDLAGRHLDELSGGQRQRVYVAQGIAQEHDVLLLDEPLTGLDLVSAQRIDAIIHDEHDCGCSVLMTTHDLAEAKAADRVVLMSGRIVAAGTPDEVLTPTNLQTAYGLGALHEHDIFFDDPH